MRKQDSRSDNALKRKFLNESRGKVDGLKRGMWTVSKVVGPLKHEWSGWAKTLLKNEIRLILMLISSYVVCWMPLQVFNMMKVFNSSLLHIPDCKPIEDVLVTMTWLNPVSRPEMTFLWIIKYDPSFRWSILCFMLFVGNSSDCEHYKCLKKWLEDDYHWPNGVYLIDRA